MQMPFDVVGRLGPKNRVLDGRAHQCHLANTFERLCTAAMCHHGWRRGLFPNYFAQRKSRRLDSSRNQYDAELFCRDNELTIAM